MIPNSYIAEKKEEFRRIEQGTADRNGWFRETIYENRSSSDNRKTNSRSVRLFLQIKNTILLFRSSKNNRI